VNAAPPFDYTADVARAIAAAKLDEDAMSPEERAEWDAWERASVEGLPPWTGPDLTCLEN
jgi:hypothetical protein